MQILFVSGREAMYMRNTVILKGLRENGIRIVECTSSSNFYLLRYPNVLKKFILSRKKDIDLIFVGYFGQPLVPIVEKLSNKPIILDAFLSTYDTMCFDRKKFGPNSYTGRLFYWMDKHSCELADGVLLDTHAHIDYFVKTFNLRKEKFHRVFLGCDDSIFYPRNIKNNKKNKRFTIFYYTTYHPLHGVEYIVRAAKELESYEDIGFRIFGKGMEYKKILKLTKKLGVKNIEFDDWIPYKEFYRKIPLEIAVADICLGGHFSNIGKAKRVIGEKTFEFIAMKKPVILGNNPANKELFEDRKNALLVEMANPDALADAILELKENNSLGEEIAEEGYRTFKEKCLPKVIGKNILKIIKGMM